VQEDERALFFAGDTSYTQLLLLDQVVDGLPQMKLWQTLQQILTYIQSVPTVYLPTHDPDSAHRLATWMAVTEPVQLSVMGIRESLPSQYGKESVREKKAG
jgi:glyoxylase-like metal-dependent hydrolase (beta-lactamase superfamily II)